MFKGVVIHIIVLLASTTAYAGSLIFTSGFGGDNSNGAVVQYDLDRNNITTPISLAGNPLAGRNIYQNPYIISSPAAPPGIGNGLTEGTDGYVYGVDEYSALAPTLVDKLTRSSIANATGIIYRFHPDNYKVEVLHAFTGSAPLFSPGYPVASLDNGLREPRFGLIEPSPGVFYGLCVKGGANDYGGVYKYTVATGEYKKIGDFTADATLGRYPTGPLFLGPSNELYGILQNKDNPNLDFGYLFKIDSTTDTLVFVDSLETTAGLSGYNPTGRMVYNPIANSIYGCNKLSFDTPSIGGGAVFTYNFSSGDAVNKVSIANYEMDILGSLLSGMVRAENAQYYAVTTDKGASGNGSLLLFANNSLTRLHSFSQRPNGNSLRTAGTKIYGTYSGPLVFDTSAQFNMWSYDVTTGAFEDLMPAGDQFGGDIQPAFAMTGNTILTRNSYDPKTGFGYIVEHDKATDLDTVVSQGHSPDGSLAVGELLDLGNWEYLGFAQIDGATDPQEPNYFGSILKYDLKNRTVTRVASLAEISGPSIRSKSVTYKSNAMIKASNGKVYFTVGSFATLTSYLVPQWIVELDLETSQYTVRDIVGTIDSEYSNFFGIAGLIEYEPGKLALVSVGKVYEYDISGGGFTAEAPVQTHDIATYGSAYGNLVKASDGLLYGFTRRILTGFTDKATLFSLDPTGWGITFYDLPDGVSEANIGLAEYNGKLYGSTKSGGTNDHGYIFSYDPTSPAITIEYSFDAATDGLIFGAGWLVQEDKLYSTSTYGGANGFGTLVEFDPATKQLMVLENLTGNNGYSWRGTPVYMEEFPFSWPMFIPAITRGGGN